MPQVLSAECEAVIARIGVPEPVQYSPPADVTGELARLLSWWASVSNGSRPITVELVSTAEVSDVASGIAAGVEAAERACDSGATLLVPRTAESNPVAALTVIGVLTRTEASAITFQSTGMTDRQWIDLCAAVRDASADVSDLRSAPVDVLDFLAAQHIAFIVGALLSASARRTPCIVEGIDELAAALVADRLSFRAKEWWRAGSTTPDPGRQAAVDRLALEPGLPLALTDDEGRGADATVALLGLLAQDSG